MTDFALQLINQRMDTLDKRLGETETEIDGIPELRLEVQLMTEAFKQFRNALIAIIPIVLGSAVAVIYLKGA